MQSQSQKKNKVGFTAGAFDLCHVGHIRMFKDAKAQCDHLIVALHIDPSVGPIEYRGKQKNKPIMSASERWEILEALKYVDSIIPYKTEEDLYDILKTIPIDIRILGSDWEGKAFTGHDLDIPCYFHKRDHEYSSTELRERIIKAKQ